MFTLLISFMLKLFTVFQGCFLPGLSFGFISSADNTRASCSTSQSRFTFFSSSPSSELRSFSSTLPLCLSFTEVYFLRMFQSFLRYLFFFILFNFIFMSATTGTWSHPTPQSATGLVLTCVMLFLNLLLTVI